MLSRNGLPGFPSGRCSRAKTVVNWGTIIPSLFLLVVLVGCSQGFLSGVIAPGQKGGNGSMEQRNESVPTPESGAENRVSVSQNTASGSEASSTAENAKETSKENKEVKSMFFSSSHTIEHVTTADFQSRVLQSTKPVLVDFYADWCPPCRMLAPVLQEVAREVDHVEIVKVNVDQEPRLASQYRVSAIPTLILFKDGQPVERITGFLPKQELKQLLAQYE